MTNDDTLLLRDPHFLMVLLATITKKYGGAVTVTEDDMSSISTEDAIGLFKDENDDTAFILKIVNKNDYADELADDGYYRPTKKSKNTTPQKYAQYDDEDWEN